MKTYLQMVRDTSSEMIEKLQDTIAEEESQIQTTNNTLDQLEEMIADTKAEKKALIRQCARDIARKPEREKEIQETYDELIAECDERIEGFENQIKMTYDKHNTIVSANRTAQLAIDLFDEILNKEKLEKNDLDLLIDKIYIYEDHIHIKLKDDIDHILHSGNANLAKEQNQQSKNTKDKKFSVSVISDGEPLSNISENLAFLLGFSIFLCNYKYFYDNFCVYKKRGFICSDPISLFFAPKKNPAQTIIFSAIRKHSKAIQFSRYTFT